MEMKGAYLIPAPRAAVWAALNDVDVLKAAIPGCETINRLSATQIEATVVAKVGPVKASFKGLVTLSDLDPPNGYTISGEGKGGVAGFAKGGAKVRLTDDPAGTLLGYEVTASVGGKLAQIGSRLIDSTAKKLADEFFASFGTLAAAQSVAQVANAQNANAQAGHAQAGHAQAGHAQAGHAQAGHAQAGHAQAGVLAAPLPAVQSAMTPAPASVTVPRAAGAYWLGIVEGLVVIGVLLTAATTG
jgi:carbon monoxide dehydrogenase subunit G